MQFLKLQVHFGGDIHEVIITRKKKVNKNTNAVFVTDNCAYKW